MPGNTTAHVCLPAALLPRDAALTLDGEAAASNQPERGQVCLVEMLGSGSHTVHAGAWLTRELQHVPAKSDDWIPWVARFEHVVGVRRSAAGVGDRAVLWNLHDGGRLPRLLRVAAELQTCMCAIH